MTKMGLLKAKEADALIKELDQDGDEEVSLGFWHGTGCLDWIRLCTDTIYLTKPQVSYDEFLAIMNLKPASEFDGLSRGDGRDEKTIKRRDPLVESALTKLSLGYLPKPDAALAGMLGDGMPSIFRPSILSKHGEGGVGAGVGGPWRGV